MERLKTAYPFMGAKHLKYEFDLPYFNAARKNRSRGYKTPWDILTQKLNKPNRGLLTMPPVMTDVRLPDYARSQFPERSSRKIANLSPGVYHVPWQV